MRTYKSMGLVQYLVGIIKSKILILERKKKVLRPKREVNY